MKSPLGTLPGVLGGSILVRGHYKFIVLHSFTSIHCSPWLERGC